MSKKHPATEEKTKKNAVYNCWLGLMCDAMPNGSGCVKDTYEIVQIM